MSAPIEEKKITSLESLQNAIKMVQQIKAEIAAINELVDILPGLESEYWERAVEKLEVDEVHATFMKKLIDSHNRSLAHYTLCLNDNSADRGGLNDVQLRILSRQCKQKSDVLTFIYQRVVHKLDRKEVVAFAKSV
jgi:hypothetical protein